MVQNFLLVFLIMTSIASVFVSERPFYFSIPFLILLLILCAHDFKSFKLPNVYNALVLLLGVGFNVYNGTGYVMPLVSFFLALMSLCAVSFMYQKARGRTGLGMGDVKLFSAGAVWLNPYLLPVVLFISSVTAIFYFLSGLMGKQTPGFDRKIPYGPFLAFAIFTCWSFETDLLLILG